VTTYRVRIDTRGFQDGE
ncbi:hypothetical protein HYFRA_00011130, partial [Hymenoscyphus fraxineus]